MPSLSIFAESRIIVPAIASFAMYMVFPWALLIVPFIVKHGPAVSFFSPLLHANTKSKEKPAANAENSVFVFKS